MTLHAEHVEFGYHALRPVLRDVSATFEPGTITAVVGPNGAGKSTLLRTLLGVLSPRRGRVLLGDADVTSFHVAERARRLVYVPQRSTVAFAYSARAVVGMGLYAAQASMQGREVRVALDRTGLGEVADQEFGTLSAGQQQRVTFARALAQLSLAPLPGSRVLLADEPVASMDPRHAVQTLGTIQELAGRGLTVVLAIHDLVGVLRCADRVVLLNGDGCVDSWGPVSSVLTPAALGRVFGIPFLRVESEGRTLALVPAPDRSSGTDARAP